MVDLHIHSEYSDGSDSVRDILEKARDLKLELISITDHNNVDVYDEIMHDNELGNIYEGKLITGVEILCRCKSNLVEVLAYGFNPDMIKNYLVVPSEVEKKSLRHLARVASEIGIKFENGILERYDSNVCPGYYYFVNELKDYYNDEYLFGKSDNKYSYFFNKHFNNPSSPFYFDYLSNFYDIKDVVNLIHKSGGISSLAHPFKYNARNKKLFTELVLAYSNVDGLECEYPTFSEEEREWLKCKCEKYNKVITGGSDYHGVNRPMNELGTGIGNNLYISYEMVESWSDGLPNVLSYKK